MDPTQIPKPLAKLAKETASKPVSAFSEFIALKLFGKTNAKLRAEADNAYKRESQRGKIERKLSEPFIIQLETMKLHRQYSNLGDMLNKATPLIIATKPKVQDDNDVFWSLLEYSKEISSDEVQELIARIIAGEYNVPGSYTMSALQTIKMLGRNELELAEKMASLLVDGERLPAEFFAMSERSRALAQPLGLDFGSLQTLQSLGLFLPNNMTSILTNSDKDELRVNYFEKSLIFKPENENYKEIKLPNHYRISDAGKQILQHLKPKYNELYYQWLREMYKIPDYSLKD